MKILFILLISVSATASTDYSCMNICNSKGYSYGFCKSKCSYDDEVKTPNRVDLACMNKCTSKGQMYGYCQQKCSY